MIRWISSALLKIFGWHVVGEPAAEKKMVIIGAPHTSNWDFPLSLLSLSALGLRFSWVGKHSLFKPPFGILFKAIGGLPVDRSRRTAFLDNIAKEFQVREHLLLAIAPEGTRSKQNHWKAGFYFIAVRAEVPICLGFVDYSSKTVGVGPHFMPSGDINRDFQIIKNFYQTKRGKFPERESELKLREKEMNLLSKETGSSS